MINSFGRVAGADGDIYALLLGSDPVPLQAMRDFLDRHLQPPALG